MFGISGTELIIILFFGFLIFGPEKLPQMGRTVGRAIRQFRTASEAANKKFKEEVADPFQDAIAPYKDQVEESAKPIKDDIEAINSTLNETKSMFTDPFKDMLAPTSPTPKKPQGAAISGGTAPDADTSRHPERSAEGDTPRHPERSAEGAEPKDLPTGSSSTRGSSTSGSGEPSAQNDDGMQDAFAGDDPFAGVIDTSRHPERSAEGAEPKDLPTTHGAVKRSLASSLYDLDDERDGE